MTAGQSAFGADEVLTRITSFRISGPPVVILVPNGIAFKKYSSWNKRMVVATFLDAVRFVARHAHHLLDGSGRAKRSSSRGHQTWRTGTTTSFLST
jgi:hypothetical protein